MTKPFDIFYSYLERDADIIAHGVHIETLSRRAADELMEHLGLCADRDAGGLGFCHDLTDAFLGNFGYFACPP